MKLKILSIVFLLISNSCQIKQLKKGSSYDYLDMSVNNGWDISFSILLDDEGKIIVREYLPAKAYLSGRLNPDEFGLIDSLIKQNMQIKDSLFIENKVDQSTTGIIISSGEKKYKYYVYGDKAPLSLLRLRDNIFRIVMNNTFVKVDTSVSFESAINLNPPRPPSRE